MGFPGREAPFFKDNFRLSNNTNIEVQIRFKKNKIIFQDTEF